MRIEVSKALITKLLFFSGLLRFDNLISPQTEGFPNFLMMKKIPDWVKFKMIILTNWKKS